MTTTAMPRQTPRTRPTAKQIDWHIRNARRLRAEAMAAAAAGLVLWLRRAMRPAVNGTSAAPAAATSEEAGFPETATPLRSPLMAIRSSAEILRDHPDMSAAQRARFVDILLEEEQRLERMLVRAFGGREMQGG